MTREHYDLIVIGAGWGARDGPRRARTEPGARVALVEHRRWGGSCPNVACTPTKAYLVAAELAHQITTLAPEIGIEAGPARTDLARVKARKDSLTTSQEQWVENLQAAGFDTYEATATFLDPQTIRAGEAELTAERILIATGSRTAVPPIDGIEDVDWLDHITALELTELPRSMLVVGAGAVGLEFGQIFSRFGSDVTIVDAAERIAPLADAEASATLAAALADEGIRLAPNVFVQSVRRDGDDVVAAIAPRDGSEPHEVRAQT